MSSDILIFLYDLVFLYFFLWLTPSRETLPRAEMCKIAAMTLVEAPSGTHFSEFKERS